MASSPPWPPRGSENGADGAAWALRTEIGSYVVVPLADQLPQLEIEDARQEAQADDVRRDHDKVAFGQSVDDPQREPAEQHQEHGQRQVAGLSRHPAFLELRKIGRAGAERGKAADGGGQVHLPFSSRSGPTTRDI